MKNNINTMFYYVSFIPMLIISLAVLCSVMPISSVVQKCFNRRSDHDDINGDVEGKTLLWSEVRNSDRNACYVVTPPSPVAKYDAENVSDKVISTIN